MEWKEIYKNRFATVEEAVRAIEDGDRLVFGHAAACPQVVPAEMIAQKERLHDIGIYHMLTLNDGSYLTPERKDISATSPILSGEIRARLSLTTGLIFFLYFFMKYHNCLMRYILWM